MAQQPKLDDPSASHTPPATVPLPAPEQPRTTTTTSAEPQVGSLPSLPVMLPGISTAERPEGNHGAGLYAVGYPSMGMEPMAMFPPSTLIPLKYTIPTRQATAAGASEGQGLEMRQQHGPQRQAAVRRFHFAFQLDLALILKLAAMVFLLSQDGSEQKLVLLILFATLVYLYQTGVLTPFIRWLQRVGTPPPRQPLGQPQNDPPAAQIERNNVQPENQNQPGNNHDAIQAGNENQLEPGRHGHNWWGVVKEIQMFVVGFITSLLPGFHNND